MIRGPVVRVALAFCQCPNEALARRQCHPAAGRLGTGSFFGETAHILQTQTGQSPTDRNTHLSKEETPPTAAKLTPATLLTPIIPVGCSIVSAGNFLHSWIHY